MLWYAEGEISQISLEMAGGYDKSYKDYYYLSLYEYGVFQENALRLFFFILSLCPHRMGRPSPLCGSILPSVFIQISSHFFAFLWISINMCFDTVLWFLLCVTYPPLARENISGTKLSNSWCTLRCTEWLRFFNWCSFKNYHVRVYRFPHVKFSLYGIAQYKRPE